MKRGDSVTLTAMTRLRREVGHIQGGRSWLTELIDAVEDLLCPEVQDQGGPQSDLT